MIPTRPPDLCPPCAPDGPAGCAVQDCVVSPFRLEVVIKVEVECLWLAFSEGERPPMID